MEGSKNENEKQSPLIENEQKNTDIQDTKNRTEIDNDLTITNFPSLKSIESFQSTSYIISRKIRWVIFFLFLMINLLMNFDHGTVPAATEQIMKYLGLNNSQLGLFGSLVFVGVIIGSLVSLTIINTFNRKYILMIFLILCTVALFLFTRTKEYILLSLDRVVIGIFQAFISIYLPLWCDQFGIEARKALMIALVQVAPPIGVLVGYIVTSLLNKHLTHLPIIGDIPINERWLYSFYIQSFIILLISFCLLFFSDNYFNSKARRVPLEVEETLNEIERQKTKLDIKNSFFYHGEQTNSEKNDGKNEIDSMSNIDDNNNDNKEKEEEKKVDENDNLNDNKKDENNENNKEEREEEKEKE